MPKIKDLIKKESEYSRNLVVRGAQQLQLKFEEGINLFVESRSQKTRLDQIRKEVNQLSDEFARNNDPSVIQKSRELGQTVKDLEVSIREQEEKLRAIETCLPNWHECDVPIGAGDECEVPLWYKGQPQVSREHVEEFQKLYSDTPFDTMITPPLHHYALVGKFIDQDKGGAVSQTRFYYELDDLVILDLALSMYAIEFFTARGYGSRLMIPPYMMRREIEERATYFESFKDTIFQLPDEGMILIPSSEHPIMAFYESTIFSKGDLPLRITAWSPCFRKEAGAHGKDTRGIFRVKQFHKVELHSIVPKDEDLAEVERYSRDISDFMTSMELPHRAVLVPCEDMDKRAIRQIDIQGWMPGQGRYRETHSIASIGTWASEKLAIRYRNDNKQIESVRNVYATAVAVQRMICVIAENHYDHDTKVIRVPLALQKYTMGKTEVRL